MLDPPLINAVLYRFFQSPQHSRQLKRQKNSTALIYRVNNDQDEAGSFPDIRV